jgi:fructan beta-fructosidase
MLTHHCRVALATFLSLLPAAPARAADERNPFDGPLRPQFHFTPQKNWMNDPNGLVFFDGEYHLFHQYNPEGDTWGHMSWGHAVSPDLVHWQHLPVALREEGGVMIFSGSAVVDRDNTSGLGTDGKPPLVAVYTGHGKGKQTQNIASSTDRGRTWTKFEGNPVIDIGSSEFRDPKVFWHGPTRKWVMVVARPDVRKVLVFGSKDLKRWEQLSEFGPQGEARGIWECPDLFELPIEDDPRRETRWVLVVNINGGTPAGGSGCQYFVGTFDGRTFTNGNPKETVLWADYGADFYAAQSWSDLPRGQRTTWLAWMSNWRYANQEPTSPFRTAMTVPRELRLVGTPAGLRLAQNPVTTLHRLRGDSLVLDTPAVVAPDSDPLRDFGFGGDCYELFVTFENLDAREFGCRLRAGPGEETLAGFDAGRGVMFLDRRRSGGTFHKDFPARHESPVVTGRMVGLHVLVDRSSVEVFGGGPTVPITDRIFPGQDSRGLSLYSVGGRATVRSLSAWKLKSAWR